MKTGATVAILPKVAVKEGLALGTLTELSLPAPLPRPEYKLVRARTRVREAVQEFCRFVREQLETPAPREVYP